MPNYAKLVVAGIWVLGSMTARAETGGGTGASPAAPAPGAPTPNLPAPVEPAGRPEDPMGTPHVVAPGPLSDEPLPPAQPGRPARAFWMSGMGASILLGGGFEDFANGDLKAMTGGGGYWNARVVARTRRYIGLEAAYVGAARNIQALGLGANAGLLSNGVEGDLRINAPLVQGRSLIEPFAFLGLGWQHYQLTNASPNTSDVANNDNVMTMPYGVGLDVAYGRFMVDVRFTSRRTYFNDLMRSTVRGRLDNWAFGGLVGLEF